MFTYCLYWTQYSCNFLVYAARSDQYRKAYLDFLVDMRNKILYRGNRKDNFDSSAILFVDKSILPPKLLQFYEHHPRFMIVNSNPSKSKKSVRFDMKNIQKDNNIHIRRSLSSFNDGKYDRTTNANTGTFYDHGESPKMNVRIHFPKKGNNNKQQSIIIANPIGESDKNQIAIGRRNSDSKLDNYVKLEGVKMKMNMNDMRGNFLDKRYFETHQRSREDFSIAVNVESIIAFPDTADLDMKNAKCKKLRDDIKSCTNHSNNIS